MRPRASRARRGCAGWAPRPTRRSGRPPPPSDVDAAWSSRFVPPRRAHPAGRGTPPIAQPRLDLAPRDGHLAMPGREIARARPRSPSHPAAALGLRRARAAPRPAAPTRFAHIVRGDVRIARAERSRSLRADLARRVGRAPRRRQARPRRSSRGRERGATPAPRRQRDAGGGASPGSRRGPHGAPRRHAGDRAEQAARARRRAVDLRRRSRAAPREEARAPTTGSAGARSIATRARSSMWRSSGPPARACSRR